MKIAPRETERFLRAPDANLRAVLVYGPDDGLVRERAEALLTSIVEDLTDPFRVAELTLDDVRNDPARLNDEADALSLTGGRRVVRLRQAGDSLAPYVSGFLDSNPDAAPGGALIVIEAGDLPGRSSLRKLFEGAKQGAALACYHDDANSLPRVIAETLRSDGLTASPDAMAYLVANLGGDRQLTRRELEKLALYKGAGCGKPADQQKNGIQISIEDAQACIGDSAVLSLDDLANAVAGGDLQGLERALERSFQEGAQPVSALRAVARHFQRLHLVAGSLAQGTTYDDAAKKLRPPIFWKASKAFERQARGWPPRMLAAALERLIEAEMACKQTGIPAASTCARALLQLAANAPTRLRAGVSKRSH